MIVGAFGGTGAFSLAVAASDSSQVCAPVCQVVPCDPRPLLQLRFGDGKPDACMLAAMSGVGKVHGLNALYREPGLILAVAVVASALASGKI